MKVSTLVHTFHARNGSQILKLGDQKFLAPGRQKYLQNKPILFRHNNLEILLKQFGHMLDNYQYIFVDDVDLNKNNARSSNKAFVTNFFKNYVHSHVRVDHQQ